MQTSPVVAMNRDKPPKWSMSFASEHDRMCLRMNMSVNQLANEQDVYSTHAVVERTLLPRRVFLRIENQLVRMGWSIIGTSANCTACTSSAREALLMASHFHDGNLRSIGAGTAGTATAAGVGYSFSYQTFILWNKMFICVVGTGQMFITFLHGHGHNSIMALVLVRTRLCSINVKLRSAKCWPMVVYPATRVTQRPTEKNK
ncbi:hypothetical protein BJY52DRAFT_597046 [Lactarius psammicola]|nr:hypothetical protein BJY52DRAFT_597046 [Lactarius psammicola]